MPEHEPPLAPGGPSWDEPAIAEVTGTCGAARCLLLAEVASAYVTNVDLQRLARVAAATVSHEDIESEVEISLLVTDDETIRGLNAQYRGVDRATDVLSYPQTLPGEERRPAPDGVLRLGDVVLSYERAVEQAASEGHAVARELDVLMTHGVLHLLGYTDYTTEDRAAMLTRGEMVLARMS